MECPKYLRRANLFSLQQTNVIGPTYAIQGDSTNEIVDLEIRFGKQIEKKIK